MTDTPAERTADSRPRRWHVPGGVRVRLTLIYTAVFFAGGLLLLALTFALVANSLGSSTGSTKPVSLSAAVLRQCKADAYGPLGPNGKAVKRPNVSLQCQKAFAAGASAERSAQRAHTMHELEVWSVLGLFALTCTSAGLGWILSGQVLRPVREITEAARRASERHLGERITLGGPDDELKELADTFDAMLDRLDLAFAVQRQFVANASHELRTPLTTMRTAIDVVLAKPDRTSEQLEMTVEKVRRWIERSELIIDALLTLAVSNQRLEESELVDLGTAAEDALDATRNESKMLGLHVETALGPAPVSGSRVLIERMVTNLVRNAVDHNEAGGWVRVLTTSSGGHAVLEVANSGPIVEPGQVAGLFEPFRRAAARTGTSGVGLGLSIVQAVAEAHAATIEARAGAAGGLQISVTMPASPRWGGSPTHPVGAVGGTEGSGAGGSGAPGAQGTAPSRAGAGGSH